MKKVRELLTCRLSFMNFVSPPPERVESKGRLRHKALEDGPGRSSLAFRDLIASNDDERDDEKDDGKDDEKDDENMLKLLRKMCHFLGLFLKVKTRF